jgi:D-xylulose reductase
MAISLVARGLIDLKPLVTHRFKFEEAVKAFGVTQNGKDEDGKVSSLLSWAGAIDMTRTSG